MDCFVAMLLTMTTSRSDCQPSLFHHDVIRIVAAAVEATSDAVMIDRRHAGVTI
jgi:hypothetical protein